MKPNDNHADLSHLVQRTLGDLTTIRHSLLAISEENREDGSGSVVLDLELAGQLKNVVDALRLLLWAYIKALSSRAAGSPYDRLRDYKTELALDMLHSARPRLQEEHEAFSPASDFERLINWALIAVSRYPASIVKTRPQ